MFRRLVVFLLIAVLAIWIAGCGAKTRIQPDSAPVNESPRSSEEPKEERSADRKAVMIVNFAFDPAEIAVKAGAKVVWTNEDGAPHQVHADTDAFKSEVMSQGDTFEQTLNAPGTVTYHCHLHQNMKGAITVE